MRKGFTFLELSIAIFIVGILATLGIARYSRVIEKGRTAEARQVLGSLRNAQIAYKQEYGVYTGVISDTGVNPPPSACAVTHYFSYTCDAGTGTCTADRCTAGGKTPNIAAASVYNKTLTIAGVFGGTIGY